MMVAMASGPMPADTTIDPLAVAEVMIGQQRFKDARSVIEVLAAHPTHERARNDQVQFLLGILDIEDKDYDSAIAHFHRILVHDPGQVRVRLELGRAYFLKKDYFDAQRQFLFARAGHLPPLVQTNVDRFVGAIRALQTFSYGLSFSLAADSNLNAGPATDTVSLYGLPFQLSPDARANKGIGLAVDVNAEWSPAIVNGLKWRFGSQIHRSQYRQTAFDDMTLGAYLGPHVTLGHQDFNLLGSVSRRWYGNRTYADSAAVTLDATWYVNARLGLGGSAAVSRLDYPENPLQTGVGHTYGLNGFFAPSSASIVRASGSFGVQGARAPAYTDHSHQFGLSYSRELKGGLTVSLAPSYTHIAFAAPLAAFPDGVRRDHQISGQVSLLDRKLDWSGFTPRLAYTWTHNCSTIPLYAFNRSRIELGFTRAF